MSFKFAQIFKSDNSALKSKVIDFWTSEKCMPEDEAKRRINEALLAILDANDNVVSVCSGKALYLDSLRDWFLYYRSYTKPEFRNLDFGKALLAQVIDFMNSLEVRTIEGVNVKGVYVVFENDILNESIKDFVTKKTKLTLIGFNDKNQQMRVAFFDGAKLKN